MQDKLFHWANQKLHMSTMRSLPYEEAGLEQSPDETQEETPYFGAQYETASDYNSGSERDQFEMALHSRPFSSGSVKTSQSD